MKPARPVGKTVAQRLKDEFLAGETLADAARSQASRKMPFGPYKGLPLDQLPADYIRETLGWITDNGSGLVQELQRELEGRTT